MQQRAVCFDCAEEVEHSPVYEAPCGHEGCPSAVFHGVCLMRWRERRDEVIETVMAYLANHRRDERE